MSNQNLAAAPLLAHPSQRGQRVPALSLLIDVPKAIQLEVGRLGRIEFPAGRYVYTGSARRALEAQIARHVRPDKPQRWHIDWLTTVPGVTARVHLRSTRPECELNQATPGTILVGGFGASDCRAGCGAHLKRLPDRSRFAHA
jgi:Uri superfamily endonuclease